jgi:DNA-binding IclR family transcriptional regulator
MKNTERNPISKALGALGWIVQNSASDIGVRDLAAGLGVSPSSAHRILGALSDAGFVESSESKGRYKVGLEMIRLANMVAGRMPLREAAMKRMRRLVDLCNETALLGAYDHGRKQMIFAATVESTHPLRYAIELNKWVPVHAGASGLAILAFLGEDETQAVIERTRLAALTDQTITEAYRLRAELEEIRRRGYAITRGQRIPGAVGLAAPVFGSGGRVVGDVCLTIPQQRFDESSVQQITKLLLECTEGVTSDIGGKPNAYSEQAA